MAGKSARASGPRHPALRTAAAAVLGASMLLLVTATPAAAHGRGSDASNYISTITGTADVADVQWRIYGGDELLQVVNTGDSEVVVLGYSDEPFLRVGPDGVFENRNSPATYLNQDRYSQTEPPANADAAAEPDWVKVSSGNSAAWHDHRIHWMSPEPPPAAVDAGLDVETVVFEDWRVPFEVAGERHEVAGELRWVPGVSPWPWLLVGLVLSSLALVGLRTRPVDRRWPGLARPAALVLGVIVVLNLTHLVDDFVAVPMPASQVALSAGQTALFLAIGAFGAWRAWRGGDGAFTALGVGAGAVLVGQGLLYWSVLTAPALATVFPLPLARLTVALSVAQAIPMAVVAILGTRATLPPPEEEEDEATATGEVAAKA